MSVALSSIVLLQRVALQRFAMRSVESFSIFCQHSTPSGEFSLDLFVFTVESSFKIPRAGIILHLESCLFFHFHCFVCTLTAWPFALDRKSPLTLFIQYISASHLAYNIFSHISCFCDLRPPLPPLSVTYHSAASAHFSYFPNYL